MAYFCADVLRPLDISRLSLTLSTKYHPGPRHSSALGFAPHPLLVNLAPDWRYLMQSKLEWIQPSPLVEQWVAACVAVGRKLVWSFVTRHLAPNWQQFAARRHAPVNIVTRALMPCAACRMQQSRRPAKQ